MKSQNINLKAICPKNNIIYQQLHCERKGDHMTRLEEMERYLRPFLYDRVRKKVAGTEMRVTDCVPKEIEALLWEAVKRQGTETWKPAYLAVFHFHSSLLTGTYQYQVHLMNEQMYFDDNVVECDWFPSFLYGTMEEEKEALSQELKRKFVRVKEYEINHGLRRLAKEYKFHFLFGDYMGEIKSILTYEGGNIYVR
jgi:hypothetical protein